MQSRQYTHAELEFQNLNKYIAKFEACRVVAILDRGLASEKEG
jgi:hypothetical protein